MNILSYLVDRRMLAARRFATASARRAISMRMMTTAPTEAVNEGESEILKVIYQGLPNLPGPKPVAPSADPKPQNIANASADLKASIEHYYHGTKTPYAKDNNLSRYVKLSMLVNDVGAEKVDTDLKKIMSVVTDVNRRNGLEEEKSSEELTAVFKAVDPRVADFFRSECARKAQETMEFFPEDTEPGSIVPVPPAISFTIDAEAIEAKHIRGDGPITAFLYSMRNSRFRQAVMFIGGAIIVGLAFETAVVGYHPVPYDVLENYKVVDRKEKEFLMSGGAVRYADIK